MSICSKLPDCAQCLRPACDHTKEEPHTIELTCDGYKYPQWMFCDNCGMIATLHNEEAPHALEGMCDGFVYQPTMTASSFQGGGGSFGGGGATGSW